MEKREAKFQKNVEGVRRIGKLKTKWTDTASKRMSLSLTDASMLA